MVFINNKDQSEIRLIYFIDLDPKDGCFAVYVSHALKSVLRLLLVEERGLALQVGDNLKFFSNFLELTLTINPTPAARRDWRLLFKVL